MSEQKIPIPAMLYNAAVGGHVTNSQQIIDEDYNIEQKDVNKEVLGVPYNATTPNGMGRVVLKKTDNFKEVVEAQTNGNTIFIIKYDFTLTDNVTIPTNCVLEFDGGSLSGAYTLTGQNTKINAGIYKIFDINISFSGSFILRNGINIAWFGAIPGNDITNIFIKVLKNAVDISYDSPNGWQCAASIIIPEGNYTISSNLATGFGNAKQFLIKGAYKFGTKLYFTGNVMFDDDNIFGFTRFEDIAFIGNNTNTFMKMYGIGAEQSISFCNCLFREFSTILESIGTVMNSEITFANCSIKYCGSINSPSNIFIADNSQGVNWRFFATDIESCVGTVFKIKKGGGIYYYQGSFVIFGGNSNSTIINIPSDAEQSGFGDGDRPTITFFGVRFELHENTHLLTKNKESPNPTFDFIECSFLQSDKPNGLYTVDVIGLGTLQTIRCSFPINIRVTDGSLTNVFHYITDFKNIQDYVTTTGEGRLIVQDLLTERRYFVNGNGGVGYTINENAPIKTFLMRRGQYLQLMYVYQGNTSNSVIYDNCGNIISVRYKHEIQQEGDHPFTLNIYSIDYNDTETLVCSFTGLNTNAANDTELKNFPMIINTKKIKAEVVFNTPASSTVIIQGELYISMI